MATKAEKDQTLIEERLTALRTGEPPPNPTGEILAFDPTVPGLWRKATPEEAADHTAHLDAETLANRAHAAAHPVTEDTP